MGEKMDAFRKRVNDAVNKENGSEHDALIVAYCKIEALEGQIEVLKSVYVNPPDDVEPTP